MKPDYEALGRAQAAVETARAPYDTALAELRAIEEQLDDEIQQVWEIIQAALQDAKTQQKVAVENLARVEVETSSDARARDRDHPVLNEAEQARVAAAEALVAEAAQQVDEAVARVKAGVTPEALARLAEG